MMYYGIMILAAAAVLHFVYESIIAPSLRLELRFELFKLRDEVRQLKIASLHGDAQKDAQNDVQRPEFVERHFRDLQDSINSLICILHRFDLAAICAISKAIDRDAALKERVAARARSLHDCVIPEVLAIRRKQFRIALKALAANSGPMLVWLALPVSLFSGYQAVRNQIKNSLTVPGTDLRRLMPDHSPLDVGLPVPRGY